MIQLIQALHAGISRRDWHATEMAANAIRDTANAEGELISALRSFLNIASHCEIKSGVCGCGEDMAEHSDPMFAGHSPVDMADQVVRSAIDEAEAAIAKAIPSVRVEERV